MQIEPRLERLYQKIRRIKDDPKTMDYFCANEHWYGKTVRDGYRHGFKKQMVLFGRL